MIVNFGYGANSHNEASIGQGFLAPDAGVRESAGGGGGGDDDTAVMVTREGMTDHSWFDLIKK